MVLNVYIYRLIMYYIRLSKHAFDAFHLIIAKFAILDVCSLDFFKIDGAEIDEQN